ncbi:hypothetical protein GCM10010253_45870 [Streptomyces badius]|uniref:Uncharacterized protein n=1 Tax=Streptomyces badius TaxID=1941 RepID=A0ABQ2TFN9_STRBA|nr:hypothetical protein GCM10010253_45870 [Streptomyces badius]
MRVAPAAMPGGSRGRRSTSASRQGLSAVSRSTYAVQSAMRRLRSRSASDRGPGAPVRGYRPDRPVDQVRRGRREQPERLRGRLSGWSTAFRAGVRRFGWTRRFRVPGRRADKGLRRGRQGGRNTFRTGSDLRFRRDPQAVSGGRN